MDPSRSCLRRLLAAVAIALLVPVHSSAAPGAMRIEVVVPARLDGAQDAVESRAAAAVPITSEALAALQPRSVGPAATGGRVHDIEGIPGDPSTLWVATASGGLWKTTNRGHVWVDTFEGMPVSTFGDVALAASDPDIVYAGTGEQNNRQSTSWGNGVYRSDDGGETWTHLGLVETRHIGKIEIHPDDPDVAWVAALGNLWMGSDERGVYRTVDGGTTWEKVLAGENQWTGAVDLVLDPSDPDVLYAAMYQRLRRTWGFNGGGPGGGIWKTSDGGDTWEELAEGIPGGDKGRIGLAIARSNPVVLNASIETADEATTGTYRTTDAGATWTRVSERNFRPMYYSEIFIDPSDEDVVYSLATRSAVSDDGGRTWTDISARFTYDVGVHSDHHALWIDPGDPEHFYLGGDAGVYETYDRGINYRKTTNLPIGQFYAVGVDMRDPYWIYGGMQDNHSWMGPSRTRRWIGIIGDDWRQIGFGDGMYWQPDPTSHRYVYGNAQNGGYVRFDAETGDRLPIRPVEPEGEEYRFDWASPSLISRHDPKTVYVAGNRLFLSRDRGETWIRTEDLSTATDRDSLELMGVRGADIAISRHDGTASYGEATTVAESPLDADVLWVGTDDGNVQVSTDGGRAWTEVSGAVHGVAPGTYVSRVVASAAARETAYATFDAHRDGDFAPYVFRTRDLGRSWEPLHEGLPSGSVNSLAEHPDNRDVLFLGTEHALFVSTDAGDSWARMPNLPTTAYDDLLIHPREQDLVMGTHGRSIWILDDIRPIAGWNSAVVSEPLHLFPVRPVTIVQYWKNTSYRGTDEFRGDNPVDGALITYRIGAAVAGKALLTVRSPEDRVVRRLTVPGGPGVHRVNWDLRHGLSPDPDGTDGPAEVWGSQVTGRLPRSVEPRGPFVRPGVYTVALEAGNEQRVRSVEVRLDPAMADRVTDVQLRDRERFLLGLIDLERRIDARLDEIAAGRGSGGRVGVELRVLRDQARRLYRALEGEGVQQGSLYPPTEEHRRAQRRLEQRVGELSGSR